MHSRTGGYALRILGYLADRPDRWIGCRALAAITGIPHNYLSKIMNQLGKRGIVRSRKGWGGGFCLSSASRAVSIWEVLAGC